MQKEQIGVRVPEGVRAFFKRRAGASKVREAEAIRRALEAYKDIYEALGDDWWEIERRANASEQPLGRVIATMAKAALEGDRKKK